MREIIGSALILAIGLFAERIASADSGKQVQGTVTSATTAQRPRGNGIRSRPRDNGIQSQPRGWGIEGIVKDEKGQPIAGARVDNWNGKGNETRTTLSDKNGHYALDDLHESPFGFRIVVQAVGRSPVEQEVQPDPAGKPARVDFTLPPGHVLHGRVVDENGKPIAGALVSLLIAFRMREPGTQSDKDGRFEIDSLPADAKFVVSRFGYTKLWNVPLKLDASGLVTVVLQPMGAIRGRVVDAQSGKRLEHFRVWLNGTRTGQASHIIPAPWDTALFYPGRKFVSSDGTFTIPDLTNKMAAEVSVGADGHTKCVLPVVAVPIDTAPLNEAQAVTFSLTRIGPATLARFSGHVLDHKGQPAGGANLRLIVSSKPANGPADPDFNWLLITSRDIAGYWYCDQFLEAVSDPQGRFEFKDVLPGKHWQLAYWGSGVARDRVLGTTPTVPGPAPPITIKLPHSAQVVVTIDRVKYANAWQLAAQLRGADSMNLEIDLHRGQTKAEINDLGPGDYDLYIFARPVVENGAVSIEGIATQAIHLKPGETKQVRF